jgi:hypothetical protein
MPNSHLDKDFSVRRLSAFDRKPPLAAFIAQDLPLDNTQPMIDKAAIGNWPTRLAAAAATPRSQAIPAKSPGRIAQNEQHKEYSSKMSIFVLLQGFPGVGKLTIAKELASLLSAKIVDNHWFNNPILRLLDDDGTAPLPSSVWEYTGRVRQAVLDAMAAYSAPSANFIFTHAAAAGDERSIRTYGQFLDAAGQCGAVFVPVRLLCSEEELALRISSPARRERLKSIDVETSRHRSRNATVLDIPHPNAFTLDVTFKSPMESAVAIRDHVASLRGTTG